MTHVLRGQLLVLLSCSQEIGFPYNLRVFRVLVVTEGQEVVSKQFQEHKEVLSEDPVYVSAPYWYCRCTPLFTFSNIFVRMFVRADTVSKLSRYWERRVYVLLTNAKKIKK